MTLLRRYFDWKAENDWIWSVERVRSMMIRLSEEHSIDVSAKDGTSNTTPHPIGNAPALGLVWDRIPHLLLVLILSSEYRNISMVKTYMRAYSLNKISITCGTRVSMSILAEFFHVVFPATEFRVRTRPRPWFGPEPISDECIRTCSTFEPLQHLHHSTQCGAVDLDLVLWSHQEWFVPTLI